jgi:hypothetical protein
MKVWAHNQTRAILQNRRDQFLGRSRVGRRLDDDRRPGSQVAGECLGGLLDVAQVRHPLVQRRGYRDDRDVEA